jgi:hypothetical protein
MPPLVSGATWLRKWHRRSIAWAAVAADNADDRQAKKACFTARAEYDRANRALLARKVLLF